MRFFRRIDRWRAALLAVTAVVAVGCIDYQESIEVGRDGSVEIKVYATLLKSALPMVKNRPELRQLMLIPIERGAAEKLLPPSAKVLYWNVQDGPGIRIFDAAIRFDSLDEVQKHIGAFASSQNFRLYRDNEGNYRYEREVPAYPINENLGIGKTLLERQLGNSRLEFTLRVPTRLLATNGERLDDRAVVWKTDLPALRQQGMTMSATIAPPPETDWLPWLIAALCAGGLFAWVRSRRSRRRWEVGRGSLPATTDVLPPPAGP